MSEPVSRARDDKEWNIAALLRWASADFQRHGSDSARLDAELLLAHALGVDRIRLILEAQRVLEPQELSAFKDSVRRRRAGEPVAYILGFREFYGLPLGVDARVLIPRPDTETLVEVALARTQRRSMYGRALDLCTGSGCVAIAFARARPTWQLTALDLSAGALSVARLNAARMGTVWGIRFMEGDLFAALASGERFELITANPPYVPSAEVAALERTIRDFEPRLALDGGADGLDVVRRIIAGASAHLATAGVLALEIGAGQSDAVAGLFSAAGFEALERRLDYGGHERVVSGRRP